MRNQGLMSESKYPVLMQLLHKLILIIVSCFVFFRYLLIFPFWLGFSNKQRYTPIFEINSQIFQVQLQKQFFFKKCNDCIIILLSSAAEAQSPRPQLIPPQQHPGPGNRSEIRSEMRSNYTREANEDSESNYSEKYERNIVRQISF